MKRRVDERQVAFLPPDGAALLHLVRENLRLLGELARRYEIDHLLPAANGPSVRTPADLAAYLGPELADLPQEQLRVVHLDLRNRVLGSSLVYQGGLNATVIRHADVYREAIRLGAAAIVLVHNHPSGDPTPSPEDVSFTTEAGKVGDLLGIELLDHLVIGRPHNASLRALGLYQPGPAKTPSRRSRSRAR